MANKKMSVVTVLRTFFAREGQTANEFLKELKALSIDERNELAIGAAQVMGVELEAK